MNKVYRYCFVDVLVSANVIQTDNVFVTLDRSSAQLTPFPAFSFSLSQRVLLLRKM